MPLDVSTFHCVRTLGDLVTLTYQKGEFKSTLTIVPMESPKTITPVSMNGIDTCSVVQAWSTITMVYHLRKKEREIFQLNAFFSKYEINQIAKMLIPHHAHKNMTRTL